VSARNRGRFAPAGANRLDGQSVGKARGDRELRPPPARLAFSEAGEPLSSALRRFRTVDKRICATQSPETEWPDHYTTEYNTQIGIDGPSCLPSAE
jgi:hypothetical protein